MSEDEKYKLLNDLCYLWSVINSPMKAGNKWCTYSRESINESIKRLKSVMVAEGFSFKALIEREAP